MTSDHPILAGHPLSTVLSGVCPWSVVSSIEVLLQITMSSRRASGCVRFGTAVPVGTSVFLLSKWLLLPVIHKLRHAADHLHAAYSPVNAVEGVYTNMLFNHLIVVNAISTFVRVISDILTDLFSAHILCQILI